MVAALLTFDRHWKHLTSTRLPLLAFLKHKFKMEADAEYCLHVMTELWDWPGGKVFSLDWQLLFASVRGALQATDPSMVGSKGWGVMGGSWGHWVGKGGWGGTGAPRGWGWPYLVHGRQPSGLWTAAAAVGNFLRTLLHANWVLGMGLIFAWPKCTFSNWLKWAAYAKWQTPFD